MMLFYDTRIRHADDFRCDAASLMILMPLTPPCHCLRDAMLRDFAITLLRDTPHADFRRHAAMAAAISPRRYADTFDNNACCSRHAMLAMIRRRYAYAIRPSAPYAPLMLPCRDYAIVVYAAIL